MSYEIANIQQPSPPSGIVRSGGLTNALHIGGLLRLDFPSVATVGAAVAVTTLQSRLFVSRTHRIRGFVTGAKTATAVTAGTDPAVDVYRHLPVPGTLTAALVSPAAAGNVETGVHKYAVVFYNAAGSTTPGATVSVTVADNAVNGQVALSGIPIGPTGTTGRKIYRTLTGATTLTLLATIADNTTTTYTDNIADATLSGAVPTANAAGATILSATVKLSSAEIRSLVDQHIAGTLAADPSPIDPCMYSLRAVTGASTGALADLAASLFVEFLD